MALWESLADKRPVKFAVASFALWLVLLSWSVRTSYCAVTQPRLLAADARIYLRHVCRRACQRTLAYLGEEGTKTD
jgi:hypothetical protein